MEISMELYLGLAELIVPEHKFKKWQTKFLKVVCIFVSIAILALLIGGLALIFDEDKTNPTAGIIMASVGGGLLLTHIVLEVILIVNDIQKERRKKKELENEENDDEDNDDEDNIIDISK